MVNKKCGTCKKVHIFETVQDVVDHEGFLPSDPSDPLLWFNCTCHSTLVVLIDDLSE